MPGLSEVHRHPIEGKFYARLEGSEGVDSDPAPRNQEETRNAAIAFDAVHADWFESSRESFFAFDEGLEDSVRDYWSGLSRGRPSDSPDDPYEPVPAFRVEVSLRPDHRWIAQALDAPDQWVELNLGESGEYEVDVYRGLFDLDPGVAWMSARPRPVHARLASQLSTVFDMDSWPDASDEDLKGVFDSLPPIEQLISFDVGQGTATCLARDCWCLLCSDALRLEGRSTVAYGDPSWICEHLSCRIEEACAAGLPVCYFDLGCGVYRNARTRPRNIRFCNCSDPPVILSHWDTDHWAGALEDTRFLRSRWVAPRQSIGPSHVKFASKILQSGGSILIVPKDQQCVPWGGRCEEITLQRATGTDRNDSGLIMQVRNRCENKNWLLTGDADYEHIPHLPDEVAAMTVPHHGASKCRVSPPAPSNKSASRLLYSFGPGNEHGCNGVSHPRRATVDAHVKAGWKSPGWNSGTPGDRVAKGTTLATAQHPNTHLRWAAAGWDRTPPQPGRLMRCLGVTTPPQT